jgi:hypothetical protein
MAIPGEDDIKSVENQDLIANVYDELVNLVDANDAFGSTRFDSHGYMGGFTNFPDIRMLIERFPEVEFKFIYDMIVFRTKGSTGWYDGGLGNNDDPTYPIPTTIDFDNITPEDLPPRA